MEHQQHDGERKHASGGSDLVTLRVKRKTMGVIVVIVIVLILGYMFKGLFVAATVDGSPITRLAVVEELEKVSGKQALDSLIAKKLVNTEARKKGVVVSDDEINIEISKIEDQVKAQGGTLEQALAAQGMTRDILKEQIRTQKMLEKLITNKIEVTDAEVAQYIKDNKVSVPADQEEKYNSLVKDQLTQQKLNAARQSLASDLKARATIHTFVSY